MWWSFEIFLKKLSFTKIHIMKGGWPSGSVSDSDVIVIEDMEWSRYTANSDAANLQIFGKISSHELQ